MSRSLLLLCCLLACSTLTLAVPDVVFTLNSDSTATIRVNGATWLRTAATWFTAGGKMYSSADKTLVLEASDSSDGVDALGQYNATVLTWQASDSAALRWMTIYRTYLTRHSPVLVFDQVWVSGSDGTSVGNSDGVLSAFPSFSPKGSSTTLGALQWSDAFDGNHEFIWSGPNATASLPLSRGGASGPLVLFDRRGRVAVTLSPFSSFMSASLAASKAGIAEFGVVGSMLSVPAGYSMSTIAVFGDSGVTNTVLAWGDALLSQYGKIRMAAWEEHTTRYLGYATDNGAYYYVSPRRHSLHNASHSLCCCSLTRALVLLSLLAALSTTRRMGATTSRRCRTCTTTLWRAASRTGTCCWTRGGTTRARWAE